MYFHNENEYDPKIPILKNDSGMITDLIRAKMAEAESKRTNAAYSGAWDDGGCHKILDELRLFSYGWNHEVPPEWQDIVKQQENEKDPDYKVFLELKKRFEG
jgi:hypothetical protein